MKINVQTLTRKISKKEVESFVKQYPEVQAWIRIKGAKTQLNYVKKLMRYLMILKENGIAETPQDLYNIAKESENKHVEVLEDFQLSCDDAIGKGKALVFNITIAVKSFYSFKGKLYQFPKGRADYQCSKKKAKRIPKLEEIIPYIDTIPYLRNKMIVALETSFPCRLESLTYLKWKHFKEVLENKELPHVYLTSEEMKGRGRGFYKGIEQHSFLTPFSKDYVLRWKEEYEQIAKVKIDPNNPESLELPFLISYKGETKGEKLSYGAMNLLFDRAKTERFPFTLHVWRTFVNEALKLARIQKEDRDIILGHKIDDIELAYSNLNIERLREEFRGAVKYLDPTFKEDERTKKVQEWVKAKKGIEISDKEARELLDTILMKFLGSS